MAVLLTYQCMQVPTWGTITLGQASAFDQDSAQPSAACCLGFQSIHELMFIDQSAILKQPPKPEARRHDVCVASLV